MNHPIRVYRNLNNGLWSVQKTATGKQSDYRVSGHVAAIALRDVSVKQSEKSRDRARAQGVRNVHCMAVGHPIEGAQWQSTAGLREVTYNPFKHDTLVWADTQKPFPGAERAVFTNGKMFATNR